MASARPKQNKLISATGDSSKTEDGNNGYEKMQEDWELEEIEHARLASVPADASCCLRDGRRQIDFVIVWEETLEETSRAIECSGTDGSDKTSFVSKTDKARKERLKHERWRKAFYRNLKKKLIVEEEEKVVGNEKIIHFTKLHAPFDALCYYAEKLCFRAPLQAYPIKADNWSAKALRALRIPNFMDQEVPRYPLHYYTCQFRQSKLKRFYGSDQPSTFFNQTQRSRVVWEILCETLYGKRRLAQVGIERLLDEDVFAAAYPLHCGEYKAKASVAGNELNDRQLLRRFWACWGVWYHYQPLDHIRAYFGEQISLYFAWLGFYTAWLLPASIVGILVFIYGMATVFFDHKSGYICNEGNNVTMCPISATSPYWQYGDTCLYARISYLFDHPGTVFYAGFVSLWAVFFLEYWKRTNANLAHRWDCQGFEDEEEAIRPKYAALAPTSERNPITGVMEPHFPKNMRWPRIISAVVAIALMIILVLIFIVAVILYRILINIPLFQVEALRSKSALIASFSAAIVNLILIMALAKVYEILAYKLTEWEMHRTQSAFDDALIVKGFIFQFFNFYSSIIYIGFFKGKFVGYPGHYNSFLGLRPEECGNGSCLVELALQLGVIMVGKQLIGNVQEIFIPKLKTMFHRYKLGGFSYIFSEKDSSRPRWEEDYDMIDNEGLYEEYMEMILQFGFITIFVAAFPLAPLFALLNNWAEIRLDAQKLICETRRPVAERAQDIGIWFEILEILTRLAVVSNAFLIAFTSDFIAQMVYKADVDSSLLNYVEHSLAWAPANTTSQPCRYIAYRDPEGKTTDFYWKVLVAKLAFVIVFEHVVFSIQRLIDLAVPDVPEKLQLKIKREKYLAKQALADTEDLDKIISPDGQMTEGKGKKPATAGSKVKIISEADTDKLV